MTLERTDTGHMTDSTIHFHILTLFPDMFSPMQSQGIFSRALSNNLVKLSLYDIRDYTSDRHKQVDDYPFGGGPGMLMKPEPIFRAFDKINSNNFRTSSGLVRPIVSPNEISVIPRSMSFEIISITFL